MNNDYLQSLTDDELAEAVIRSLTEAEAAALTSACLIASAKGEDRVDIRVAKTCCDLAGADPERLLPFLGYVPLKGHANGWANVEKGSNGPGLVGPGQTLGLFVFRSLGGVLRANLRFNHTPEE